MLLVDDQSGSVDLYPYIKALEPNTILTRIDPPYGDITWWGEWAEGTVLKVGVEYKKLDDVLTCMVDGRFGGHQLPGMLNEAKYDRIYLLVEMGRTRADRNSGVLQKMRGDKWWDITRGGRGFTYRELEHWFTTWEEFAQVRVVRTFDEYDSARWVKSKYTWWTSKGYEEHSAHKQFHVPPPPAAIFERPSLVRLVARVLPDIEWERSRAVANHFRSIRRMINAERGEWAAVPVGENKLGHKLTIGPNRAGKIVDAINKEVGA